MFRNAERMHLNMMTFINDWTLRVTAQDYIFLSPLEEAYPPIKRVRTNTS